VEIAMSSPPSPALAPRPDHVPEALVIDYDIFNVPGAQEDAHLAIRAVAQTAPEIFWTPRNGGHWVAAGGEAVAAMTADHERFSSDCIFVPQKPKEAQREFPIESDPPRHTAIRRPLTVALLPGVVAKREQAIRDLAISLIEGLADRGECEFVSEFAQLFPIGIFLDLVQLPARDRPMLLDMAKRIINGRTPEIRHAALAELIAYLGPVVRQRRETPGDDLLSPLVNVIEHDGEKIREADAISYANTVLLAGLDTVAAMLSFVTRFLALHPEHRRELIARLDDDAFLKGAVEEFIRRHGIVGIGRVVMGTSIIAASRCAGTRASSCCRRWSGSTSGSTNARSTSTSAVTRPRCMRCSASASMPAPARCWPGENSRSSSRNGSSGFPISP
jgi:cytochrome P450